MVSNKLDNIDMAVIHSLMNDGRKSFRQIAKEIKVSTPTVESHFSRMKRFGIIKTIQPIINIDNVAKNPISTISSLVFIKLDLSQSEETISKLSLTPGVTDIYKMTGEHNIIIKLIAVSPEHLEDIVTRKIAILKGIKSISYEIITKSVKGKNNDNNENNTALLVASLKEGSSFKVTCEYCKNQTVRENIKVLKIGQIDRHFCCNSCLKLYKDKYSWRIRAIDDVANSSASSLL